MASLFDQAVNDLRRHSGIVIAYLAVTTALLAVYRIPAHVLAAADPAVLPISAVSLMHLGLALYLAVASSAVQAIFFAALGVEIARPVWKCKGWRDALRRFFIPWLILNLLLITIIDISARMINAEQTDLATILELLLIAVHIASIPVGCAIMFWGGLDWHDLPSAMAPLGRFFQWTLLPLGIALLQYGLIEARYMVLEGNDLITLVSFSVTDIPIVLMDIFIFTLVWRICLHNQMNPKDVDEDPIDF